MKIYAEWEHGGAWFSPDYGDVFGERIIWLDLNFRKVILTAVRKWHPRAEDGYPGIRLLREFSDKMDKTQDGIRQW